ncbi:MAG: hypothetical protein JWO31_3846 [Phycisphaerales bacterium]|nr:hypothetical protein [Phycisphaerales bacterium]
MIVRAFVILFVALMAVRAAAAAEKDSPTPANASKTATWKALFDGTNTDAWRGWESDKFPAKGWVVEDHCLKLQESNGRPNGGGGDLVTREAFSDFELRWEWKISKGGNSGLKYLLGGGPGSPKHEPLYSGDKGLDVWGHEYQLLDDVGHPDAKRGATHQTASLYDLIAPTGKKLRPLGEFNDSRLLIRGDHVEHWLNDVKVVEYELGGPALAAALEKSKYKKLPGFGTKKRTPVLLQDHGEEVWFRNIRVRDLTPGAPPPAR